MTVAIASMLEPPHATESCGRSSQLLANGHAQTFGVIPESVKGSMSGSASQNDISLKDSVPAPPSLPVPDGTTPTEAKPGVQRTVTDAAPQFLTKETNVNGRLNPAVAAIARPAESAISVSAPPSPHHRPVDPTKMGARKGVVGDKLHDDHHAYHLNLDHVLNPLKRLLMKHSANANESTTTVASDGHVSLISTIPKEETAYRFDLSNGKDSSMLGSSSSAPPLLRAQSHPQTLKEKYGRMTSFLGSGANGSCFMVQRPNSAEKYAVKEFRSKNKCESSREYRKKLCSEYTIGSILHHPNIIETLDLIQEKNHTYEVMELCANGDLYTLIQSTPLTSAQIEDIFVQLIHGVKYLHNRGIAHRDLKPENCLFTSQQTLKIIDFGSADVVFRTPYNPVPKLSQGRCGSGPYIPPEEYTRRAYDARKADIWACGVILLAMYARRFPWAKAVDWDTDYAYYEKYRLLTDRQEEERARAGTQAAKPTVVEPTPSAQATDSSSQATKENANGKRHHHHHHNKEGVNGNESTRTASPTCPQMPRIFLAVDPRPRALLFKMMHPDPDRRASVEDVEADPWFRAIEAAARRPSSPAATNPIQKAGSPAPPSAHSNPTSNDQTAAALKAERTQRQDSKLEQRHEKIPVGPAARATPSKLMLAENTDI
ncbi:kinase-like domain-containing protein [Fimicolochytrium jonesii]|uniref:kinase-like domain-containing protein n=1 Tax=Fimicolochytrium jonesii TaxID=1396493 RepID=UPI0022FE9EBB|nr:kinase-like domain-containing protein [Fimicolochytrium jonesii]KAI8819820.1 kinase-like domain-containing protein [Fimicolochytrium jonesii]